MVLSKRLRRVASFVTPGGRVADVGCDHGYVPIWLVSQKTAVFAIAADVRPGPLSRAAEHVRESGLTGKIEMRLSDGLENIRPGEAESLILSGIGGLLTIRILAAQRETAHSFRELILSPQSDLEQVRRFLVEDGYTVCTEAVVKEDGKYYFILYVLPQPDGRAWREEEYVYGRDYEADSLETVTEYLRLQREKWEDIARRLPKKESGEPGRSAEIERMRRLTAVRQERVMREREST